MRRARRIAGALLALAGAGALADAAATVIWQEPVGAYQAAGAQQKLGTQYAALVRRFDDVPQPSSRYDEAPGRSYQTAALRRGHIATRLDATTSAGAALGRLRIPRIGLSTLWVQGTGPDELKKGPGHYPGTVLPGSRGTVGLAGHRTTHGAPFRHLDELRPGDRIDVSMPYGVYSYVVQGTQIVSPKQAEVLRSVRTDRLVLTACHPLWSAAQRIVVTARLTRWPVT